AGRARLGAPHPAADTVAPAGPAGADAAGGHPCGNARPDGSQAEVADGYLMDPHHRRPCLPSPTHHFQPLGLSWSYD
ncbi:hypothetical protein P5G65_33910, partial [Paenibacillus chondroitinus]